MSEELWFSSFHLGCFYLLVQNLKWIKAFKIQHWMWMLGCHLPSHILVQMQAWWDGPVLFKRHWWKQTNNSWATVKKGTFQPTTCMMPLAILMSIFANEDWYGQAAWLSLILQTTSILILLAFSFLTSTFFRWVYYTMLKWMLNKTNFPSLNVALS